MGLSLLSFGLLQCDDIIPSFDIGATPTLTFTIDISATDPLSFSDEQMIDLSTNPDFVENKDLIQGYTINKIYFEVIDYESTFTVTGSTAISFYNNGNLIGDAVTLSNVQFEQMYSLNESLDVPLTAATKNGMADVLLNEMKFAMKTEGQISDKPAKIVLKFYVVLTATVQPI